MTAEGGPPGPDAEVDDGALRLADPTDDSGRADWEKAAAAALRKQGRLTEADPDTKVWEVLTRTTLDRIAVPPIAGPDDVAGLDLATAPGVAPYTRGRLAQRPEHGWDIRPQLRGLTAAGARETAQVDLENGATSVWLTVDGSLPAGDLPTALQEVYVDLAPVVLDAPGEPEAAARALLQVCGDRGVTPAAGTNLGADPLGARLRRGWDTTPGAREADQQDTDALATVARLAADAGVLGAVVDGSVLHDRGASDAQELGFSLAVGAHYLRRLTGAGLSLAEALSVLEFRYAASDEQFPTIAKLRAARRLWARVAELCGAGPDESGQRQHAVTSRPMMTRYDPWVNMLRTTIAAFSAGVAGAEAVTVLPFDSPLGVPDDFGRRVARNISSVLVAESHLGAVADPAGGSYQVERLTDDLARAAWAELGRIEESGGVLAALADGSLRHRVEEVAEQRENDVARRKRPVTGVTEFPNLGEQLPERPAWPEDEEVRHYGAAFEAMRDHPPARPVFLATMGTLAAYTARATFTTNLLAAGGIAVTEAGPTEGPEELAAAYTRAVSEQGAGPVACLAGSDADYAAWGADAVAALRAAGAEHVVLAGKPGEKTVDPDLLDDSAAMGVDALQFLTTMREQLA